MAAGEDTNRSVARLLGSADPRQVQQVGGNSLGITLSQQDVQLGDTVFIEDAAEENVKRLILPE